MSITEADVPFGATMIGRDEADNASTEADVPFGATMIGRDEADK